MDVSDHNIENSQARGITLSVCVRCRDGAERGDDDERGGLRFARVILRERRAKFDSLPHHTVRGVRCMSQCKRPCTIALSGPNRFTYLFGDLDPLRDAGAVLGVLAAYADALEGFLPRDQRPEALRAGILGRIPPLCTRCDLVTPLAGPLHSLVGDLT